MIRSKIAMEFLWVILLAALQVWPFVPGAKGQSSRKDDIVFNSRGVPLAGASVRVCAMPAAGQPCTPLALIYSDAALTQALANPTTTDGLGNYFFYAAPGKYMIEISGPGITTKQIPNVILPLDPTSPTFSSPISAFSLTLSGNLTVNGNTTVAGNLASGTLNLTNQASPPGAAGTGTVNLYTKTADKRLYYKDDAGTEIGPIAATSGAQTNVTNTFTATQNFDGDLQAKGPNPYFSISRYGAYSSSTTPVSTTCTFTAASATATCASAIDFANGQGLVGYKAGTAPTLITPAQPTVTPIGVLNGATTYNYQVIAEDHQGGLTAASATGTTTTGAATLGINQVNLTQASRSGGTTTYTSSANHNLQAGQQIVICQFGAGVGGGCPGAGLDFLDDFNGVKVITSTPTPATFTVNDGNLPDRSESSSQAFLQINACNKLTFSSSSYSGDGTLRYWIYRNGAGPKGVAVGLDPFFIDCGQDILSGTVPGYVPAVPPAAAQAGYLATTIVSGGGTTTLTLANAATTSSASATTLHDNTPALQQAMQAAYAVGGGTVYIPAVSPAATGAFVFNSALDIPAFAIATSTVRILSNGAVQLNQPWILGPSTEIEGQPKATNSFQYVTGAVFQGTAHPFFYIGPTSSAAQHLSRLKLALSSPQQTAVYADNVSSGSGVNGLVIDYVGAGCGAIPCRPYIMKGQFDFFFNGGVCSNSGTIWSGVPCLEFTNSSSALTGANPASIPGRVMINGLYFAGGAIQVDNLPNSNSNGGRNYTIRNSLYESGLGPYMRVNTPNNQVDAHSYYNVDGADLALGVGTPFIDLSNSTNTQFLSWTDGTISFTLEPLIVGCNGGAAATTIALSHGPTNYIGDSNCKWTNNGVGFGEVNGVAIGAFGANGKFLYRMATPSPAQSAAVSAGGSVPVGSRIYTVTAVDPDGSQTVQSAAVTAVTTSGSQTVTVTLPATFPAGAKGVNVYRDGALVNAGSCLSPQFTTPGGTYVDTFGFTCGASAPQFTGAGSSFLSSSGVSTYKATIGGEALTASPRAGQNVFLPGALTTAWTGATWTTDKAVTITRMQVQAKTAPSGCTTNAIVRLTDGATPVNLTLTAAANDSGPIAQNYAAGAALTVSVQTAASGCTTVPADASVVIQYKMQ